MILHASSDATLYRRARLTADSTAQADCLLVRHGRVAWVGREQDLGTGPWVTVDLGAAEVLPAPHDAHVHLLEYARLRQKADLRSARSASDVARRIAEHARKRPDDPWVEGHGWNEATWTDGSQPHRTMLDAVVGDRPVLLERADGHSAWANSAALRLADVTRDTATPVNGRIERDADGEPTGVLREHATHLVSRHLPTPSLPRHIQALREVQAGVHALGLAGVHCLGGRESLEAVRALQTRRDLSLRLLLLPDYDLMQDLIAEEIQCGDGDDRLRFGQLKLFADGSLGSGTAWLLEGRADRPDDRGMSMHEQQRLGEMVAQAHVAGWPCAIHAIGDAAVRAALDAIAAAPRTARPLPDRIEHAQLLHPDDLAPDRWRSVCPSMQPVHLSTDWRVAQRQWGPRLAHGYAWAPLLRAAGILAFGSDSPVEPLNPWAGLQVAVTGRDLKGEPAEGLGHDRALSFEQALRGFTQGPRAAAGLPGKPLTPGQPADFLVMPPRPALQELHTWRPRATFIDGEPAWGSL